MIFSRRSRRTLALLLAYSTFCGIAGTFLAQATLHPAHRVLRAEDELAAQKIAQDLDSDLEDVSITTSDSTTLSGWNIRPHRDNGNAVILFHGLGDNRLGMVGYAQLLLARGFSVLLPDARAHGRSAGPLATYGLLERNDIRQWLDYLLAHQHPRCIYGLGESMGAAELLQSLTVEPRFCAVIAESPFSSFHEIAYDRMGQPFHLGPWFGRTLFRPVIEVAFLYVSFKYRLNMYQVSPENAVASSHVPILLIHGEIDRNIPVRHSRRIHDRNPNTVLWEVPNADHCGAISAAPEEFQQRILARFTTAQELKIDP